MASVPIADDLFTWPSDAPALIGSRCTSCTAVTFPRSAGCPRCGSTLLDDEQLPRSGTVWTWTSQGFLPKAPYIGKETPGDFQPWVVASVELTGALRVEGRVVGVTPAEMSIGLPVHLVVVPLSTDSDGNDIMNFAFAPGTGADHV